MRELVAASTLPTLQVDVSDDDVASAVERVADWIEAGRPEVQDTRL